MTRPYKHIAELYAYLMKFIKYDEWADYYLQLADGIPDSTRVLELASGNCKMAGFLKVHFPNMIVSDIAIEMLQECTHANMLQVCCDMTALPFKQKFGLIISAFDSVNYLLTKTALYGLFRGIKNLLSDDGIFTFDVSLEGNSIRHERYLNRTGIYRGMQYLQKSEYNKRNRIHSNRFILMFNDGTVVEEVHKQKIFPIDTYFEIMEDCGLFVKNCFEAFTKYDINSGSDRAQFVVAKRR